MIRLCYVTDRQDRSEISDWVQGSKMTCMYLEGLILSMCAVPLLLLVSNFRKEKTRGGSEKGRNNKD